MARLTSTTLAGGYASIAELNANFAAIDAEFEKCLYRDGEATNTWTANQDANSKRLLNLPDAASNQEPATLAQVTAALATGDPLLSAPQTAGGILWAQSAGAISADGLMIAVNTSDAESFALVGNSVTAALLNGTTKSTLTLTGTGADLDFDIVTKGTGVLKSSGSQVVTVGHASWTDLTDAGATTLHKHDHGGMDGLSDDDHTIYALADGTRGWTLGSDATGDIYYRTAGGAIARLAVGSNTEVLTLAAGLPSWAAPAGGSGGFTAETVVATTSGTSHTFTIPADTKIIHLGLDGVGTNTTSYLRLRLGDAGGIETTGYLYSRITLTEAGAVGVDAPTTAEFAFTESMAVTVDATATLVLMDDATNKWSLFIQSRESGGTIATSCVGTKALTAELTTVELSAGSGHTFDAGAFGCIHST